jgi:hypothetical protein
MPTSLATKSAVALLMMLSSEFVSAQTSPAPQQGTTTQETRPATSTFEGDSGMWFVPTAELLSTDPKKRLSLNLHRADFDVNPGSTDIAHFSVGAAYAVHRQIELFGSWRALTRVDRDEEPLFNPGPAGGIANDFPSLTSGFGQGVGDLVLGVKVNLASQANQDRFAFAIRPLVKLALRSADRGVSTGESDFQVDAVVSQEVNQRLEWSAFAGATKRGDPLGIDLSNGIRWGAGTMFPTRSPFRVFGELHGEKLTQKSATVAEDAAIRQQESMIPMLNPQRSPVNVNVGAIWQHYGGFFIGAGLQFNVNQRGVSAGSHVGIQGRIGFHRGVRIYQIPTAP